jgi:hypothetical protein
MHTRRLERSLEPAPDQAPIDQGNISVQGIGPNLAENPLVFVSHSLILTHSLFDNHRTGIHRSLQPFD